MSTKIPAVTGMMKGWEPRFRDHPAINWIFDYAHAFDFSDMKKGPFTAWHTENFTFTKSDGTVVAGGAPSWAAVLEVYAPFVAHFHEPFFFVAWDTPTGCELFGAAKVFALLPVPGEQTKTDLSGGMWDVESPGAFHFVLEKDATGPKGLKLKSEILFADRIPMVGEMIKRGMVTPEQVFTPHWEATLRVTTLFCSERLSLRQCICTTVLRWKY